MRRADRALLLMFAAVALVVVAWLENTLDTKAQLAIFYVIPVVVVAWRVGRRLALLVALLATLTWLLADLVVLGARVADLTTLGTSTVRLSIFAGLAWLITALREERDRLRTTLRVVADAHERQEALISSLRDPILIVSRDGVVTDRNRAADGFFGREGIVGRKIGELLPFAGPPPSGGATPHWSGPVTDVGGRTVAVDVTATQVVAPTEAHWSLYAMHDVTQHAEVMRLREQLLYDVAHELRGPLGVLDGSLEILEDEQATLSNDERGTLIRAARRTAQRLRTLMEDLLSAGSIQAGRFTVAPGVSALGSIIDEAIESVQLHLAAKDQRVDVTAAPASVLADARYVRQVLSNLLSNASKYGPVGGTIRVTSEPLADQVRIAVDDDGPGIPSEQRQGLFERYYRVGRGGTSEPGVGLGLAIAKGIVDAHGGRIGVESASGHGTRVWFTLPSAPAEPQ